MAKLGAEYSDDLSPTSDSGSSDFAGGSNDEESEGGTDASGDSSLDVFPIMQLPVEIRAKILNMINQRQVPSLRLVCKQWREEVNQFYEFSFSIYDTTSNLSLIKNLRCRECILWKLTRDLKSEVLFEHPSYIKVIKVFGPTSSENLKNLISSTINLEHLTLTRRANYPSILNLQDTPALSNLTELRFLRLNSEEHLQIHRHSASNQSLKIPPMMDCYFPKLKVFEILKRFPVWHYSHYVSSVLKFVSRHSETLAQIELDFIPLSCIVWLGGRGDGLDDAISSSEEEEWDFVNASLCPRRSQPSSRRRDDRNFISAQEINITQLCKIRLQKMCITTMGCSRDIHIWKSLLESQSHPFQTDDIKQEELSHGLRELRFDWVCRDPMTETRARVSGFPWIHFQTPVASNCSTLVHVELANLSMVMKAFPSSPVTSTSEFLGRPAERPVHKVVPFDLSIFRNCTRLKSLVLRCRENHARIHPVDLGHFGPEEVAVGGNGAIAGEGADDMNEPAGPGDGAPERHAVVATVREILLMINAVDLPESIEQLEIFRFPMFTSDIAACVKKLGNLKKLFFHECGKTSNYGVDADIITHIAKLRQLKFLEIVGFNDATDESRQMLEIIFQRIGRPFEGQDTWLELCDGSTTAFETLQAVVD